MNLTCLFAGKEIQGVESRDEGTEKSENGEKGRIRFALYTIPTLGHMTIYLYLFGLLHVLISIPRDLCMYLEASRTF